MTQGNYRTPQLIGFQVGTPYVLSPFQNIRDAALFQWQAANRPEGHMNIHNVGDTDLRLGFFASPDNADTVPYAPVTVRDGDSDVTEVTVVPGGQVQVFVPRTYDIAASGRIELTANPSDGDTIDIQDHSGTTRTFEFDNDSSIGGDVTVTIGSDKEATASNLLSAINGDSFNVTAVQHLRLNDTVDVYQETVGSAGNNSMSTSNSNAVTLTGLQGGGNSVGDANFRAIRVLQDAEKVAGYIALMYWDGNIRRIGSTAELDVA